MTAELQAIRDRLQLGETAELRAKGVSFGKLTRRKNASWDASQVEGLPRMSIIPAGMTEYPTPLRFKMGIAALSTIRLAIRSLVKYNDVFA